MENDKFSLNISKEILECKNPSMCEIWNWEGDLTILPFKVKLILIKWIDLIKNSGISYDKNIKEYLKINYYENKDFDKKSFFFITFRSDTAGCAYLDKDTIKYLLVNKKYFNKGVENTLIKLCLNKLIEKNEEVSLINIDRNTTNIDIDKLIFK